jgi:hypothetical protein
VQAGIALEGPEALRRREPEEQAGKLDIVWIGHRFGTDPYPLSACPGKPLERLPGGRRDAALVTGDSRLRGAGPAGEGALGETGGDAQLAHERMGGLHVNTIPY